MPVLEPDARQPRCLEILPKGADPDTGWETWYVERMGLDGKVDLRRGQPPHDREWVGLSEEKYRWVLRAELCGVAL